MLIKYFLNAACPEHFDKLNVTPVEWVYFPHDVTVKDKLLKIKYTKVSHNGSCPHGKGKMLKTDLIGC